MVWGLVWLQEQIPNWHGFKRDWTTCSECDHHARLNNHLNWGDPYDHWWAQESSFRKCVRHSYEHWQLWGKWLWAWFGFANHLALIACFISYNRCNKTTWKTSATIYCSKKYSSVTFGSHLCLQLRTICLYFSINYRFSLVTSLEPNM